MSNEGASDAAGDNDSASESSNTVVDMTLHQDILDVVTYEFYSMYEGEKAGRSVPDLAEDTYVSVLLCARCRTPITTTRNIIHERSFAACSKYVYSYELDLFDNEKPIWAYSATNPSSARFDVLRVKPYLVLPSTAPSCSSGSAHEPKSEANAEQSHATSMRDTEEGGGHDNSNDSGDAAAASCTSHSIDETAAESTTMPHMQTAHPQQSAAPTPAPVQTHTNDEESSSADPDEEAHAQMEESSFSEMDWQYRAAKLRVVLMSHAYYRDHSFFAGYDWCMCACANCGHMLGWGFAPHNEVDAHGCLGAMSTESDALDAEAPSNNDGEGVSVVQDEEQQTQPHTPLQQEEAGLVEPQLDNDEEDENASEEEEDVNRHGDTADEEEQQQQQRVSDDEGESSDEELKEDGSLNHAHEKQLMPHFLGLIVTRCVGVPRYSMRELQCKLRCHRRMMMLSKREDRETVVSLYRTIKQCLFNLRRSDTPSLEELIELAETFREE